jgi:hypothetical protein
MESFLRPVLVVLMLWSSLLLRGQEWYPWNPDANNDEYIGTYDLLSLLSIYGSQFVLDAPENEEFTLALQPAGILSYDRCEGYCFSIGGHVATITELRAFPDSMFFGLGDTVALGYNYWTGTYYGEIIHVNQENSKRFSYQSGGTLLSDTNYPIYFRFERSLGSSSTGNESDYFSFSGMPGPFPVSYEAGCICAGKIMNN